MELLCFLQPAQVLRYNLFLFDVSQRGVREEALWVCEDVWMAFFFFAIPPISFIILHKSLERKSPYRRLYLA